MERALSPTGQTAARRAVSAELDCEETRAGLRGCRIWPWRHGLPQQPADDCMETEGLEAARDIAGQALIPDMALDGLADADMAAHRTPQAIDPDCMATSSNSQNHDHGAFLSIYNDSTLSRRDCAKSAATG
jgi:hypothetical protein